MFKIIYPVAVYMSKMKVLFSLMPCSSPMGVSPAWMAGPRMKPRVWKSENKAMCVVRSDSYVAFDR